MEPVEIQDNSQASLIQKLRTRWRSTLLLSVGFVFFGLGAIQLVPVDRNNPDVTCEINWTSAETRALAVDACYDCHSNETTWPWYSKVAPSSWLVSGHVQEGREYINFSEWDLQNNPDRLVNEFSEVIEEGSMPPWDYRLMHSNAKLTDDEKQQLIDGFRQTVSQNGNNCAQ